MKLINPSTPRVHDYTGNGSITHAHLSAGETYIVKFKEFDTNAFRGSFRTCLFMNPGDFILKRMTSGRIGAYEITKMYGFRPSPELGEPFRDYSCELVCCGYYNIKTKKIEIFTHYGEKIEPEPDGVVDLLLKFPVWLPGLIINIIGVGTFVWIWFSLFK